MSQKTDEPSKTPYHLAPANWLLLNIENIRRDTTGQPAVFVGMYMNLMMAMWQNEGQLNGNESQLIRVSGATVSQWMRHRRALSKLFAEGPRVWTMKPESESA